MRPVAKLCLTRLLIVARDICRYYLQVRGSAMSLQNGGVASGGRVAAGARARKHTSVSVDTLDDVCFKSTTAFRCVVIPCHRCAGKPGKSPV